MSRDQALHIAAGGGAGENVTMIWSPTWARPALAPPLTMLRDVAIGVTSGEGADGELGPTALVATTVKV